jgi:hypothetical protein
MEGAVGEAARNIFEQANFDDCSSLDLSSLDGYSSIDEGSSLDAPFA